MNQTDRPSEKDDIKGARVNRVPSEELNLEDLPSEWAEEDREIEGRKPDLGEAEEDTGEL